MNRALLLILAVAMTLLVTGVSASQMLSDGEPSARGPDRDTYAPVDEEAVPELKLVYSSQEDLNDDRNGKDSSETSFAVPETGMVKIWLKAVSQPTSCDQQGQGVVTLELADPSGSTVFSQSFDKTEDVTLEYSSPKTGTWTLDASAVKFGDAYKTGYELRAYVEV